MLGIVSTWFWVDILYLNTWAFSVAVSVGVAYPKAECGFMVCTWASKGLPCHYLGVYAMKRQGAVSIAHEVVV